MLPVAPPPTPPAAAPDVELAALDLTRPGLFAAGDIRAEAAKQLVTAAGDGVTAAIRAEHYLTDHFDHGE